MSGRVDVVGHLDQIDALTEGLAQLFGVDTDGCAGLLGHEDGPKGLWHLLIAETEEEEDQERPENQSGDQAGLSPD